ncbi:hypothetical protein QMK19_23130 [Streptomyces sp. H10-C2]|uniref:hypothetical protein n=1 Tax=unclassified Streptomyces TaxID=2593676 RepID=UPI0024B8EDE8|nr:MULTISPECIES: hypothetical protein [unclassified Streptomyces]MDJ0342800.1 hypothetical protein [Streptomyces sp. PH10-H1]MDJ0372478.1 hypothetical protein [Streptomyces sp. H10-C2]
MSSMTSIVLNPRSGWISEEEERDNQRGFERDETDMALQLTVRFAGSKQRGASTGSRPRRTLRTLTSVALVPVTSGTGRGADDSGPICVFWTCRCRN